MDEETRVRFKAALENAPYRRMAKTWEKCTNPKSVQRMNRPRRNFRTRNVDFSAGF